MHQISTSEDLCISTSRGINVLKSVEFIFYYYLRKSTKYRIRRNIKNTTTDLINLVFCG